MALSLAGDRMTVGSCNTTIRFWDVKAGQVGGPVESHTDVVVFIAPLLDSQQQVSGSHITLRMWDATTNQVIASPFADQVGRL
jgi:WD40 repeat protein